MIFPCQPTWTNLHCWRHPSSSVWLSLYLVALHPAQYVCVLLSLGQCPAPHAAFSIVLCVYTTGCIIAVFAFLGTSSSVHAFHGVHAHFSSLAIESHFCPELCSLVQSNRQLNGGPLWSANLNQSTLLGAPAMTP